MAVPGYLVTDLVYATLAIAVVIPVVPERQRDIHAFLSWLAVLLSFITSLLLLRATADGELILYDGLVIHDRFSSAMMLVASAASIIILFATRADPDKWPSHPAFYSLMPLVLFGLFYMTGSYDALVLLASWLIVSIASYVIISLPGDRDSRGAAVRYILMGAVATLFVVFWLALHSGMPQGLDAFSYKPYGERTIASLALPMLLVGLGFKLGIVPFHWWLPSVYGRADGRVVAIVAGVAKIGFIAALARVIQTATLDPVASEKAALALAGLSVVTMTYGNLAALTTRNLQLILAYSSIAHVGYILVAMSALAYLVPVDKAYAMLALAAIALHSLAYSLSKAPLFVLSHETGGEVRGLARTSPSGAISASVLLMSLLGVPPLLGFWGKLYMFLAAIRYSLPLVLIALVNSGVSAVYYAIAIRDMLAKEQGKAVRAQVSMALLIAAGLTIILGLVAPKVLSTFTPVPWP